MNWIKFKDKFPTKDMSYIYVTDSKEIWIDNNCGTLFPEYIDCYWMPVFMPDLPKKELHSCKKDGEECWETTEHRLRTRHMYCDFCPFCGYSVGDE